MHTDWMLQKDVFQDIAHHFYVSEVDLFVATSRPQYFSSGCLSTGLEHAAEEFRPPTSGATVSNSSDGEKRQSNFPTSSPRLARPTIAARSVSTDSDRYTVLSSQGEVPTVSAFWPRSRLTALAVSQSDCMADIGSAYQAAGFPEEMTNFLLVSWSKSTKKHYQGPWLAWSDWCSSRGLYPSQHRSQMC